MVMRLLLSSVFLLVLPSVIYGKSATTEVLNKSASFELKGYPDNIDLTDTLTVTLALMADLDVTGPHAKDVQSLPLLVSTTDDGISFTKQVANVLNTTKKSITKLFSVTFGMPANVPPRRERIPINISASFDDRQVAIIINVTDNRSKSR